MDQIKKILIGIDFSPACASALGQAIRIAALNRTRVMAMHVVPLPVYTIPDGAFIPLEFPPVELLLSEAQERWSRWPAAKEAGEAVSFETMLGVPRIELIERVRQSSADLLVVGAHGELDAQSGVGATASACVQSAPTKVLVVREGQAQAFKSVTACIDFTDTSMLALEQAIRIAALDGAMLHIVHVYENPWRGETPPRNINVHMPDIAEQYKQAVEKHLKAFCEPFAHEIGALKATFHAVLCKGHGKGIVDFVTRERCDLVVLGTRAKWNFRDFFMGSTAERVVRDAPCSALTVKPHGFGQEP